MRRTRRTRPAPGVDDVRIVRRVDVDTPAAWGDHLARHGNPDHGTPDWHGGTLAEVADRLILGDTRHAADVRSRAQALAREVVRLRDVHVATSRPDVVGHRVSVPAYLAGVPNCMVRRAAAPAPAPVRIVVELNCLSTVRVETMRNRGVAIVGMIEALQSVGRPVELYGVITNTNHGGRDYQIVTVRVPTPVATATALGLFANVGAFRRGFGLPGWGGTDMPRVHPIEDLLPLTRIGAPDDDTTDIVLPRIYSDSEVADPLAYVRRYLAAAAGEELRGVRT